MKVMKRPRAILLMVIAALLCPALLSAAPAAAAEDRVVIADFSSGIGEMGAPTGWQVAEKSGKADYTVVTDSGERALLLRSTNTSFSVQKKVNVDISQYPVLSWKWKVTKLPKGGDFRKSETDDQAAQLFLAFTKTKAIVYIWDTSAPQGLMESTSPVPFMTVKVVVVRSGTAELGKWVAETRNVYEDYRKLYGEEPPPVSGVRLQINSQHTKSSAESLFADVELRKH
jgi:Protein of unknown function (DUF3047)